MKDIWVDWTKVLRFEWMEKVLAMVAMVRKADLNQEQEDPVQMDFRKFQCLSVYTLQYRLKLWE